MVYPQFITSSPHWRFEFQPASQWLFNTCGWKGDG